MTGLKKITLWMLAAALILVVAVFGETWFMPGPVSRSHADIESRCRLCHPGFAGTPNGSCLACKDRMGLDPGRGIHRYAPVRRCTACHVEHRTRDYPLASDWIDPDRFDHGWTGFRLGRYHDGLACEKCHPTGRPRRAARPACDDCHHNFSPGPWDHDKTGCRLDTLHAGLECRGCHVKGWGQGREPACEACHPGQGYGPRRVCLGPGRGASGGRPELGKRLRN
ncbi:MAG: hypothetical protein KKB20_05865 [Proteobacteria bacterium]|nr:hypothetical protein [Pseudomonadota bacterium]